jgi:SAM-dependent methyltransferase
MTTNSYLINSKRFGWGPREAALNPDKVKLLKKYAHGKCLDVGSGSGVYTNFLHTIGLNATGIDNEKEFVLAARKKFKQVIFTKGDAYKLPYKNNQFDTVIAFDILEHLDDTRALNEFFRVAKRIIFSVPHKNQKIIERYGLSYSHYLDDTHKRVYDLKILKEISKKNNYEIIILNNSLPISVSGLLIERLSGDSLLKKYLLKIILKPFLPEPPLHSTIFGVFEKPKRA